MNDTSPAMRAVAVSCLVLLGCSHGATQPGGTAGWLELETEYFVLQTDLAQDDAREVARQLEEVRSAMIAGSWHGNRLRADKIRVVELADQAEMREFTPRGISGFFTEEALFGEQLMVMSAEQSPSQQPTMTTPEVIDEVRAATRARLHDPRGWLLLGEVLPDSDFLERKAALEKAVALAPSDVVTLDALAWDHLRGGRGPEALTVAVRAATLATGRASTLDALGAALAMSGRCADAVKAEERAVELLTETASTRSRTAASARLQAFRNGCRDIPLK